MNVIGALIGIAGALSLSVCAALAAGDEVICGPGWDQAVAASAAAVGDSGGGFFDFFAGDGNYRARTHCMVNAAGEPDWPWIAVFIAVNAMIIVGYFRIFVFWRRSYLAEEQQDRNKKLMDLAWIFLLCAVCGYVLSIMTFVWPAYRLAVVFLGVLAFFTWKFAHNLGDLRISLSAKRYRRELRESLEARNRELEHLVAARTEELERAKQEALAASHAKSTFLANMSHEIRTPMTAILGYSDLVLEDADVSEPTREASATIQRNASHLLSVINDILDLSKIEAGQIEIERVACNPVEVLREAVAMLTSRAVAKGVELNASVETSVPRSVLCDPTRLRQVVVNLLSNAIKFTEEGRIDAAVGYDYSTRQLRYGVRDTGIGMSAEQIERVFDPFVQADASTSRRFGGTGLGLAISRRIAWLLGGDLIVTSTLGDGSEFLFTATAAAKGEGCVPAGDLPDEATVRAESNATAPTLHGDVLLVEDGEDNQRLLSYLLTKAGARVTLARNGQEAIEAVELRGEFDLILMDMQMPVMDGYHATSVLRSSGYKGSIVALTAHAMAHELDRCIAAGCDATASKPIDRSALLTLSDTWMRRSDAAA